MARETNQILGHGAEADGIEEYDNPLPDWWLGLFVGTIVWSVGYTAWHFLVPGTSQVDHYTAEMAAAEARWPTPTGPVKLTLDADAVAAGEVVYQQTCASCHKPDLSGGIGPNLVDATWIHGSSPDEIAAVVTNGVAAKGMPAWGPVLGPTKVAHVTAFIVSKQGSAPSAPPEPAPVAAVPVSDDPLAAGAETFSTYCVACHGVGGVGAAVGPSLVDDTWIHGSDLDSIKRTITEGVIDKGMTPWGPILGDEKIDQVARYVQSLGSK